MKLKIFIAAMFLIMALSAIVIVAGGYTNGFESVQSLYITVNDSVAKVESSILIPSYVPAEFKLKNAGFTKKTEFDYSILIYANASSDLTYTADGVEYKFAETGDLTQYFDIEQSESSFIINGCSVVEEILAELHPNRIIELQGTVPNLPFTLSVINNETSQALSYYLGLAPSNVFSVVLNPSELIFGGTLTP